MALVLKQRGTYQLYESTHGHRILVLDDADAYVWLHGDTSPILQLSQRDHHRRRTLAHGRYLYVDVDRDPAFVDQPHLFLERGNAYQELVLPRGLPSRTDEPTRLVETDTTIAASELERRLTASLSP